MRDENTIELQELYEIERYLKKRQDAVDGRKREIFSHQRNADQIIVDDVLMKEDVKPDVVNYVLGQSAGYVDGFKAAINVIVDALSSEYREIPMTEHELYMLTELGEQKERAWLKDYKQRRIMEKSGWKINYKDFTCPVWVKEEKESEENKDEV